MTVDQAMCWPGVEPGFPFRPEMAPQGDEPVVVKHFCSAFQGTNLGDLLAAKEVRRVIICGMQTEYCVDTICRSAFERGYAVTLIGDAHTTFDSEVMAADEIIRHHNATLAGGFATVHAAEAVRFGARPA
jgi:nicotinamidase-related amidase